MRAMIVRNGVVVNACECTQEWANEHGAIQSDTADIGDLWDGTNFTKLPPLSQAEMDAQIASEVESVMTANKERRLWFEVNFNQENRVRVLEGRPQVSRQQYKDALVNLYKTF